MTDGQDTEITLGTGKLLGLFFGLVIVCALFFGLGFSMGRNTVKSTLTMEGAPSTSLPLSPSAGSKVAGGIPEKQQATSDTSDSQDSGGSVKPSVASDTAGNSAPEVRGAPLMNSAGAYTVQVAAVSKEEDAEALVSALRKKSYPVFIAPTATDKLFHVQIGPFADLRDAESTKAKLTGDGYNPILKR